MYFFPRNLDFGAYKNAYEVYSPARALNVQNWWNVKYDAGTLAMSIPRILLDPQPQCT